MIKTNNNDNENWDKVFFSSGADVFDRVSMFLETLYRDMKKGICGKNTIIISHGLFCRLFLTRYYHWTVSVLVRGVNI